VKVSITVNLSPHPPKMNRRSQLRSHSLLNKLTKKTVSDFGQISAKLVRELPNKMFIVTDKWQ